VVICGYGRSGQHLARFMEQEAVAYVALDRDPERVREAAAGGENVIYGDAARRETLLAAGVGRASTLIITFAETRAAERVLEHVRQLNPELPVIVRTLDERDIEALRHAGAAEVVPETLEVSMVLASHALRHAGVPVTQVLERFRQTRLAGYRTLRGFFHGESDLETDALDSKEARLHAIHLVAGAYAIGHTLDELDLRRLGVEVTAIRRGNIRGLEPSPETRFRVGDVVVVLGTPTAMAAAETRLLQG
jgi:CPA2 family monovalent cation:H+ antiporter-2